MPDKVEALTMLGDTAAAAEVLDGFEDRCRRTGRLSGWVAAHRCRALPAGHDGALAEVAAELFLSGRSRST